MKILPVLLLQCLTILASASAQEAYIYTHDIQPKSPSHTNTVSPETAYSIWTRRLGLSERRRMLSVEASVLEEIDLYGGYQPKLFGDPQEETTPYRLSVVVEGFDDSLTGLEHYPHITVARPSQELASGLRMKQLNIDGSSSRMFNWTFATADNLNVYFELRLAETYYGAPRGQLESVLRLMDADGGHLPHLLSLLEVDRLSASCGNEIEIASLQLDYTEMVNTTPHEKSAMIHEMLSYLNPRLASVASSGSQESIIVLLPTTARPEGSISKHRRFARQTPDDAEEETLAIPSFPESPAEQSTESNSSKPPQLGPGKYLPTCFSSKSSCINATNSCSGHGSCSEKRKGCYSCSCARTVVRKNDDGTTKSVQWGGTACEKKDISVEFWLFASFGVAMTSLIAGALGLLYTMGAEELPSVIGAGVAGPRATK